MCETISVVFCMIISREASTSKHRSSAIKPTTCIDRLPATLPMTVGSVHLEGGLPTLRPPVHANYSSPTIVGSSRDVACHFSLQILRDRYLRLEIWSIVPTQQFWAFLKGQSSKARFRCHVSSLTTTDVIDYCTKLYFVLVYDKQVHCMLILKSYIILI